MALHVSSTMCSPSVGQNCIILTHLFQCDDTRCCIIKFSPPDDEHIVLETCRNI